ncbi:MAG: sigma-54 dependent transcriptional regulator [Desulfarculaceae bacterium]|nr:sigma-54 dependent transcriptional regulator [Desulfarculaceae bacterium]MCF8071346.1 sigma-54 dependent transcriptional regulator [Desulfarculaceae bacterium]MCF8101671.1 sigma-54 dependent transcriptional regulator [Desulfarculaceae bacterium]MCF8116720.1 sigma-54 dependent transcriptional regulator [Desulfarculaceae bacterium]
MPGMTEILLIEDDDSLRESLEMFLQERGQAVTSAPTGAQGLALWRELNPQVIILDVNLPDVSGLELLPRITRQDQEVKVIVITAFHDMETTIEAMRLGAYDYIRKPLKAGDLGRAVDKALHIAAAARQTQPVVGDGHKPDPRNRIIGDTPQMHAIFKTIGLLSRNQASVLVMGETGCGKELIARVIHDSSPNRDQPFVTVDCTTLVENLLESELFGHERGAFTGAVESKKGRLELAGRGTIFFDEIGDLPLNLQAKLLRFLEYREFTPVGGTTPRRSQARIIAATNQDLEAMASERSFRPDLLFRLKVVDISVPPLRHRLADLPDLVQSFLFSINQDLNLHVTRVEEAAMERLRNHPWPGNVRELRNVLTKAAMDSRGAVLLAEAVEAALEDTGGAAAAQGGMRTLDDMEKEHILTTLNQTDWNISAAARALGVSRPTLRKRMARYAFKRPV